MTKREEIEWCDVWITQANDGKLPRVLLVGDSIARSYYAEVEKALGGQFHCARLATSKSICDPAFRKELRLALDDYKFAVIHFNNGLHGWDHDEETYGENLPRILRFTLERAPGSLLVWASSTPIRKKENLSELDPSTDRVVARNRIASEIAGEQGIPVNDLFALLVEHPEYFAEDGVHLNAQGQAVLGQRVAQCVLSLTQPRESATGATRSCQ